jgi:arginase
MKVDVIYATWPDRHGAIEWHRMAAAVRDAGFTGRLEAAGFAVAEHVLEATGPDASDIKHAFLLAGQIGPIVRASHEAGGLSVIVTGSCTVASLGAISGLGGEDTGVLWMDAHPDLNTPATTLSGMFEGMAASVILGEAWQAMADKHADLIAISRRLLCLYGARDIDPPEAAFIDEENIPNTTEVDEIAEALADCQRLYIHLDMDVHNVRNLRANRFGQKGGPSPTKVRNDLAGVAAVLPVAAIGVTAIDLSGSRAEQAIACAIDHILALCESRRATAVALE